MQSFNTVDEISKWLSNNKLEGKTIGFVPTMGALHKGHLSLVKKAQKSCDLVVASIFVNPTQFNSQEDLEKYPRTVVRDLELLSTVHCNAVFVPEIKTIYPQFPLSTTFVDVDFEGIDLVMEGKHRPGHFKGVVNVVYRLFEIVQPNKAFFGEKDYQQLAIIRKLCNQHMSDIEIINCETLREDNGLAMSSRNERLSDEGKKIAQLIYQSLELAKKLSATHKPYEVKKECSFLFDSSELELEYFEITHPENLTPLEEEWTPKARGFVAAYCEGVRLIDNMELIP